TKVIKIGDKKIGGDNPILVQSMTNVPTSDVEKTVSQIKKLEKAGCEIIRVGVPDGKAAEKLKEIKEKINLPLVADIHFSAELAIKAINQGVDKIRINPGNFPKDKLEKVVKLAKEKNIPIRIGINSGSIEKELEKKHEEADAETMVKSALSNIKRVEQFDFDQIVVSLKATDVKRTIKANQLLSQKIDYPLHLGVTEAGGEFVGSIKSSLGIGALLYQGIGDTIRVSLSADPVKEIKVAYEILKSLDLREYGVNIVSCPTCARADLDVIQTSKEIRKFTEDIKTPLKVAVMGCIVNGLGEGKNADLAVVGAENKNIIMEDGEIIKKVKKEETLSILKSKIKKKINKLNEKVQ
ncbi:MAG: flavodoxin-dependent (E)-4-hydroxy-3-methylbut-2-enyl-diphosphate synthase, partial [Minisyncoccales bacterium]